MTEANDVAPGRRANPSSPEASRRMHSVWQNGTGIEIALRRVLHARGLRYRVQLPILATHRRVADIAFPGRRVAVFVDGCFWHGCQEHETWPKQNAEFWRNKILSNQARDSDTCTRLRACGWHVLRVWAHEGPEEAADRIERVICCLEPAVGPS